MKNLASSLEKEIRTKIRQKADSYKQEEMLLLRTFKFFDYQGEGRVDLPQFNKVLSRLSVTMFSPGEIRGVFDHYCSTLPSRGRKLDYHIFINKVLGLKRGQSSDVVALRREPASVYAESGMPMGRDAPLRMVSSQEFERALEDLHGGTKRMDLMYVLKMVYKKLGSLQGQRDLDQQVVLGLFLENGLARKYQVRVY